MRRSSGDRALTSPPRTWASTWRATASSTTRPAARPPAKRSSAGTTTPCASSAIGRAAPETTVYKVELVDEQGWASPRRTAAVIRPCHGAQPRKPACPQQPSSCLTAASSPARPPPCWAPQLRRAAQRPESPGRHRNKDIHLISPIVIEPIQKLKTTPSGQRKPPAATPTRSLVALSICGSHQPHRPSWPCSSCPSCGAARSTPR